jgi:putative AdoMet-dependent methyltransferase
MRSQHVDDYNHDEYADVYDADVLHEEDPVRAGYSTLLDWVIRAAGIRPGARLLELGSGTGNLTARLPADCGEVVCVDISQRMEEIACPKLAHLPLRRFIAEDILHVFDLPIGVFDCILSTYAVHHLTRREKRLLFAQVWAHLAHGGRAVFGDLMLENAALQAAKAAYYRAAGEEETAQSIEEEFFWLLDECVADLEEIGFTVTVQRFSDLSFGVLVGKE